MQLDAERDRPGGGSRRGEREQRPRRGRVAGDVEAAPVAHERREQRERDDRLLEVEALGEVERAAEPSDDGDRELPRAPAAARERAREPDEQDPERERADAGRRREARRQDAADEPEPVRHLGRERRGDADRSDEGGSPGEQRLGPRAPQSHGLRVQRRHAGCPSRFPLGRSATRVRGALPRAVDALADVLAAVAGTSPTGTTSRGWASTSCSPPPSRRRRGRRSPARAGSSVVRGGDGDDARLRRVVRHRHLPAGGEMVEAVLEAVFGELPLAAICAIHRDRRRALPEVRAVDAPAYAGGTSCGSSSNRSRCSS